MPGTDPEREFSLKSWHRGLLAVHGVVLIPFGVAFLFSPQLTTHLWPWALMPLTGRAVGTWLVGLGIAAAHAVSENDALRIRVASISYLVFGLLQLLALARFGSEVVWSKPVAWVYLAFLVSTLVAGLQGWLQSRPPLERQSSV